jgi:D-alanyl-D-alanine carboxypeptidase
VRIVVVGLLAAVAGVIPIQAAGAQRSACPDALERAAGGDVCVNGTRRAQAVVDAIRSKKDQFSLNAVVFGVWQHGHVVATGALGTAAPGVPATRAMHFRIANTTETMTTTRLLQLVDAGKLSLDDPISKWYPDLPHANEITVRMLAASTSGYVHYLLVDAFRKAFYADVFAKWEPDQLIKYGADQPLLFNPGTDWQFSDTGFVLIGQIIEKVGGAPLPKQLERSIFDRLGLDHTRETTSAFTPQPVLHSYTDERGVWEDASAWSPSFGTHIIDTTSTIADLGRWTRAFGRGDLVSKKSHLVQVTPDPSGVGRISDGATFVFGDVVTNGWVYTVPGVLGLTGVVAYLPSEDLSIVIYTTSTMASPPGTIYSAATFNQIGAMLAPAHPPASPTG